MLWLIPSTVTDEKTAAILSLCFIELYEIPGIQPYFVAVNLQIIKLTNLKYIIKWILASVQQCNHHHNQDIKHFQHLGHLGGLVN